MLTVYTATHCPVHARTRKLVARLNQRHPQISVQVVNLDDPDTERPASVIGTPTYMWNGQIIFLGNPSESDLLFQLSKIEAL
jgi:hypothetical protein